MTERAPEDAWLEYPPYYTRQTREATWKTQCDLWGRAVRRAVSGRASPIVRVRGEEMFSNPRIDRSLPVEARVEVLEALVRSGDARWLDDARTVARVVDSADVARYEDALRAYGISGSVYTVDELARELGVDVERARAACESLEARGALKLFGDGEDGVKFA